jgi:hypothetical protein
MTTLRTGEGIASLPRPDSWPAPLDALRLEIERQDGIHPDGYPATRDGTALALFNAREELREARKAWRHGRCKCPTPRCDHHDWSAAAEEMLQAAAVIMRSWRSIQQREERRRALPDSTRDDALNHPPTWTWEGRVAIRPRRASGG